MHSQVQLGTGVGDGQICIIHATSHLEVGRGHTCAPQSRVFIVPGFPAAEAGRLNYQTKHLPITAGLLL